MTIGKWAQFAEAVIVFASRFMNNIGAVVLVAMMLMTVADVSMRYLFNHPILGSVEITNYMMVSLAFLGMAWCAVKKGNVKVDVVVEHFSPRVQGIFDSVTCFFSLAIVSLIAGYNFLEARDKMVWYETSDILKVPSYPFLLVLATGSAVLCLVLVINLIQFLRKAVRNDS